ncbi:hypothetical protein LINPERPRIM_LOCUS40261 [Linum perenne]
MTIFGAPSMNQFLLQMFRISECAYRLKLIVSDSTTEESFILLGMTAEKLLPISVTELVCAYPHDFGSFPPAIKFMIGQRVEFEVQLPKFSHSNPFGDFKICNISGLAIPRAEIIDNLPVPIAPRPLSPPSTHNTPMPGDPAYVPHVPTYVSPAASPSHACLFYCLLFTFLTFMFPFQTSSCYAY